MVNAIWKKQSHQIYIDRASEEPTNDEQFSSTNNNKIYNNNLEHTEI